MPPSIPAHADADHELTDAVPFVGLWTVKRPETPLKVWPDGGEVRTAPDQLDLYWTCAVSFPLVISSFSSVSRAIRG